MAKFLQIQSTPRQARGISLIEVMVSVLVLAVGLLGIAAMQSLALRGGQGSMETSQAVMQTTSIIEAMRANPTGNYNMGKTCSAASVPGAGLAGYDQKTWITSMKSTIGGNPSDSTTCGEIAGCPNNCTITVYWNDARAGADQGGASRSLPTTGVRI